MSKAHRYRYNPKSLAYEKIEVSFVDRIKKAIAFMVTGLFLAMVIMVISYTLFDSPKESVLKRENDQLQKQLELINKDFDQVENVLADVRKRDDNIYRVIFEADPIPEHLRRSGVGGVNRYKHLEGFDHTDMVTETARRLDNIEKQLYIQSMSFDDVIELAKTKEDMLSSIPAIQPISNVDLTRIASGFGYRIHPIHKINKFHAGMDFTAPTGTEIYATGDGKVTRADAKSGGYGNHVRIDHGYGYTTIYAHMSRISIATGQIVKRGDVIGYVGNTGLSAGPHLHYEVRKDGDAMNPANYYFNDLSPEEYELMIQISSTAGQSLD